MLFCCIFCARSSSLPNLTVFDFPFLKIHFEHHGRLHQCTSASLHMIRRLAHEGADTVFVCAQRCVVSLGVCAFIFCPIKKIMIFSWPKSNEMKNMLRNGCVEHRPLLWHTTVWPGGERPLKTVKCWRRWCCCCCWCSCETLGLNLFQLTDSFIYSTWLRLSARTGTDNTACVPYGVHSRLIHQLTPLLCGKHVRCIAKRTAPNVSFLFFLYRICTKWTYRTFCALNATFSGHNRMRPTG